MGHDDKHAATHEAGGTDALGAKAIALTTHGDMVYRAAADNMMARLPAGVAGQVLLTGGPGADPYWGTGPPPGAHEATHVLGGADAIDSALDARAIALTTHGDIVYRAAAANTLARLAPGVAGEVLLTGGPGADPYWGTGPPPGAHEATHVLGGADAIDSALDARAIALANQGDIPYRAAAANTLAPLAPGVAGQALLTGGPGADPYWGTPPGAADTRGYTIVVAASNSLDPTLAPPAYRCDGTADQVEINAALNALPAGGGMVVLMEGTFIIDGGITIPKSNVAIVGQGAATVIKVKDGHNTDIDLVSANTKDHLLIANLRLDGNKANQEFCDQQGIYWSAVTHSKIVNCWAENMYFFIMYGPGISLNSSSDFNTIGGCTTKGNGRGISLDSSSNNTVSRNMFQGNDDTGISLDSSSNNNTVSGNMCQGNGRGIYLHSSSNNTVSGNTCQGNYDDGMYIGASSNSNTISGNMCLENSQGTDNLRDNIIIGASDYNLIIGNVCRRGTLANKPRYGINIANDDCDRNCLIGNDLYDSGSTGDLNDVPTTNPTLKHDNRNLAGTGWLAEV